MSKDIKELEIIITRLKDCLNNIVDWYAIRNWHDDGFRPAEKQAEEIGKAMILLDELKEKPNKEFYFSCMKKPNNGDQILKVHFSRVKKDERVYFETEKECSDYIDYNKPFFSKSDYDKLKI